MLFGMNAPGTDTLNSRGDIRDIFLRLIATSALSFGIMTLVLYRLHDLLIGRETLEVTVIIAAVCIFIDRILFLKSPESQMLASRIFFGVEALARECGSLAMHNIRYYAHRIIGLVSMAGEACSVLTKSVLLLNQLLVFRAGNLSASGVIVSVDSCLDKTSPIRELFECRRTGFEVDRRSSVLSAMITKFGSSCSGQASVPPPTVSIKAFSGPSVSGSLTSWSA